MAAADNRFWVNKSKRLFVDAAMRYEFHLIEPPQRCKRWQGMVTLEPPNPQKVIGLRFRAGPCQNSRVVDTENSRESPWVWTVFLRVVDEDILLIERNVDDILIALSVVRCKVNPHDRVPIKSAISNDEILVLIRVANWVGFVEACIKMLLEMGKEVLL